MDNNKLKIINGGKNELESTFQLLITQPHSFKIDEFERLVQGVFKDRLGYAEIESLIAKRISVNVKDGLERNAILAIINGDNGEASRLHAAIKRRNQLGLQVIS